MASTQLTGKWYTKFNENNNSQHLLCAVLKLKRHCASLQTKIKQENLNDDGYAQSESGKSSRSVSKTWNYLPRVFSSTKKTFF